MQCFKMAGRTIYIFIHILTAWFAITPAGCCQGQALRSGDCVGGQRGRSGELLAEGLLLRLESMRHKCLDQAQHEERGCCDRKGPHGGWLLWCLFYWLYVDVDVCESGREVRQSKCNKCRGHDLGL